MNIIYKVLLHIYKDLKGDVETVIHIFKCLKDGKPILDPVKKKLFISEFKKLPAAIIKESWYWILAIIFTFAMGSLVGMEYCEMECNNFIVENCPECYMKNISHQIGMGYNYSLPVVSPGVSVPNSDIG